MSFDWKDWMQLAKELIDHHTHSSIKEAYLRASIGRSYYGVYGVAKHFLITRKKISESSLQTHKAVRDRYLRSQSRTERQIGINLRSLFQERYDADYKANAIIILSRAQVAHLLAVETLRHLVILGA